MNWIPLTDEQQLSQIKEQSMAQPVVIFKHSTRCSISTMAKGRLDRALPPGNVLFYYLDLLRYRDISNKVATVFGVQHQSPQVLIIRNGECTYEDTHNGINMDDIAEQAA